MAIDNSRPPINRSYETLPAGNRPLGGAIGGVRPDRSGPPPENAEPAQPAIALVDKPRRRTRPANDPLDLEAAFARLASLLALGEPHVDAPRGYYLNILV
jgi:hypothetical protein